MLHLTESDLRFVVETVATSRRDHDHIVNLVRDKEDLLEPMLEDPKLTERLFREEEALVRISPHLLFSILLRRVRKELEKEAYILDVDTKGKRIPIFDSPAVAEMLSDKKVRDYLAEMLSSFVRTNNGFIYWKELGTWHKRRFSDSACVTLVPRSHSRSGSYRKAIESRFHELMLITARLRSTSSCSEKTRTASA